MTRANGPGAAVCAGLDARHSETNMTVTSKGPERCGSTSRDRGAGGKSSNSGWGVAAWGHIPHSLGTEVSTALRERRS